VEAAVGYSKRYAGRLRQKEDNVTIDALIRQAAASRAAAAVKPFDEKIEGIRQQIKQREGESQTRLIASLRATCAKSGAKFSLELVKFRYHGSGDMYGHIIVDVPQNSVLGKLRTALEQASKGRGDAVCEVSKRAESLRKRYALMGKASIRKELATFLDM
jgi:hypothetical protein